jgi:hypothetical protein
MPAARGHGGKRLGGIKGDQLTSAKQVFEQQTGEPQVQINFNQAGGEKFAALTSERRQAFAIILDGKVLSRPTSTGDPGRHRRDLGQLHGAERPTGDRAQFGRAAGGSEGGRGAPSGPTLAPIRSRRV